MKLTTLSDLRNTQDLAPYTSLVQRMGEHYLRFLDQDSGGYNFPVTAGAEKDRSPGIHASELSCTRKIVYSINGTERRPDPASTDSNMRMRMRVGTLVHAQIQDEFIRMCAWEPYQAPDGQLYKLNFVPEVRISPELGGAAADHGIKSSCDGIFTFLQNDEPVLRVVLEIKTASDKDYEKTTAPKPEHIEQSHVYMACLDVPFTWVLYYNKSNSNFSRPYAPFLFRFSDKMWTSLEAKFVVATHLAETGTLPDRNETIACRWCPFSYTCQPKILNRYSQSLNSNLIASRHLGGNR